MKKDNWCLLKISINQENEHCELIDSALEATELEQLQKWFICLCEKRLPQYAHLTFIEPCISFEFLSCRDDIVRVVIHLSHELKPYFNIKQFQFEANDWCIVFDLGEYQFECVLNGIKNTLAKYPVRGKIKNKFL